MRTIILVIFWDLKIVRIFEDNRDGSVDKWVTDMKKTHRKSGEYDIQNLPVW